MTPPIPVLELGPVFGDFEDAAGLKVAYEIRGADGTPDLFRADLDFFYNGFGFRICLDHSAEMGTRFYSLFVKDEDSGEYVDMLYLVKLAATDAEARAKLQASLDSGEAAERFARMVTALGGPADLMDNPD